MSYGGGACRSGEADRRSAGEDGQERHRAADPPADRGIVPEVWVPPVEVRELRGMISYRNRLVKTSTMIRNRLQSLIHRHNLILPKKGIERQGLVGCARMSALEKIQIRQELDMLDEMEKHKAEVDAELGRQSPERCGANRRCGCCNCRALE